MNRPILLQPVEVKKSWGAESWLNATRPEGPATLHGTARSLTEHIAEHPEVLGTWARRLFGDELPIFTKVLRTDFPPLVHVGFSELVDRQLFLDWLCEEQAALRALRTQLSITSEADFDAFARAYSAWATEAGQRRWEQHVGEATITALRRTVREPLEPTLERLRINRARIVSVLHEVDLRDEVGHLLLTPAGLLHAIFGLSHQLHARDESRETLEELLVELRSLAHQGTDEDELERCFATTDLAALRTTNAAAPKNEGWLPVRIAGELVLVEPQQSSDTTFSIADFYTPFVWKAGAVRFRKGRPADGIARAELETQLAQLDFDITHLAQVRRAPKRLASISSAQVAIDVLIDDPAIWPFFTAHQVTLEPGARWEGRPGAGTFQQLVVLDGASALSDAEGALGTLDVTHPAFVPATLAGSYTLVAVDRARVLVLSVPGPHRAFPEG